MTTPSPLLSPAACAMVLDQRAFAQDSEHAQRLTQYHGKDQVVSNRAKILMAEARGATQAFRDAAAFLREHAVMRWTAALPTVPGVYWWRISGPSILVNVWAKDGGTLMIAPYDDLKASLPLATWTEVGARWCGPIPTPPGPEEESTS